MNFNTVLIIPTGIGAEIGGHAGDGTPVAKLLGSVSDKLITHPNVVNASDINEMPENTLYVEGSTLTRFLQGQIGLKEVRSNRILVAVNAPLKVETMDSVNAARVTLGADIKIVVLDTPLKLIAQKDANGQACGIVEGEQELIEQVEKIDDWDALAITTPIEVEKKVAMDYIKNGGVNPWGGVESYASELIANALNKPVAHAPSDTEADSYLKQYKEMVDPRLAAEFVSVSYMHCILKGLHKAPRIDNGGCVDAHVMVSPADCWGKPHQACLDRGIPIIVVEENKTIMNDEMHPSCIFVKNYLEAAGVIQAMKEGISLKSLRRPINHAVVINHIKLK